MLIAALAAACWIGATAHTAAALPFTVDAPVVINGGGVVATINPVFDTSGSILLSDGTVAPGFTGQDVFVVDVTVTSGTIDQIGITVGSPLFFLNPVGAGAFDDVAPGVVAPTTVVADNVALLSGLFTFGTPLVGGDQSVRLFITHSPEFDMAIGQTASFMISPGGAGDFTVQGTLIPEPGTAALLGIGILILGARRRR
jgi:hypothetical protein